MKFLRVRKDSPVTGVYSEERKLERDLGGIKTMGMSKKGPNKQDILATDLTSFVKE